MSARYGSAWRYERSPRCTRPLGLAVATAAALVTLATPSRAHQAGAPFSGAILDPLVLHHAHIENEERLNTSAVQLAPGVGGARRWAYGSELELAWSEPTFHFGVEVFVPFANTPRPDADTRATGVGDIEIRPLKLSLYMDMELVVAIATGITLPTGSQSKGLGSGHTTVAQYLLIDRAMGNWFLGVNAAAMMNEHGTRGTSFEYGVAGSYSFIGGTGSGVAAAVPAQSVVFAPSLEVIAETKLPGVEPRMTTVRVLPGVSFWWPQSGWQVRLGVATPVYGADAPEKWMLMFQVGNHRRWSRLLDPGPPPHETHETHEGH